MATVVVPLVRVTVAALPPAPLIVPETVYVCAAEVKAVTVTLAPLTVAGWLVGREGESGLRGRDGIGAISHAEAVGTGGVGRSGGYGRRTAGQGDGRRISTRSADGAGDRVRHARLEVKAVTVTLAPLTVTGWLVGVKVYPAFVGVTVYVPLATLKL